MTIVSGIVGVKRYADLRDAIHLGEAEILALIPHREPFRFVREAAICSEHDVSGIALWPAGHPIFVGHFPEFPIVPGVCQIEAGAQLAGVLFAYHASRSGLAQDMDDPLVGVLAGVRQSHFLAPVFPDAPLRLELSVGNAIGGLSIVKGAGFGLTGKKHLSFELTVGVAHRSILEGVRDSNGGSRK